MGLIVLHTSESSPGTASGVANFLIDKGWQSHEVYDPWNGDLIQLLPANVPAKSLMNLDGGVETNARPDIPYQIEVVGRAADTPHYDNAWYDNLRLHLRALCDILHTPYIFPLPFLAYPDPAFGADNGVRIPFADWSTFHGIIGHQHCPENVHGDPGALIINLLQEDDMTPESFARMIDGRYGTPDAAARVSPQGVVEIRLKEKNGAEAGWYPVADVLEFTHRGAKD